MDKLSMFRGRFEHTIDSKGRISIPAKFREVINGRDHNELIVTNEFDGCLVAYPLDEWKVLEDKISSLPDIRKEIKAYQRFFISGAVECPIDKQGRILIPPTLRDYGHLKRDVVFVGLLTKFEIWDKESWRAIPDNMEDIRSKLVDLL